MRHQLRVASGPPPDTERAAEERDHLATAFDQLERAELYVIGALDLQAGHPDRRRLLEDLRAQIAAVRRTLARPRVIG